MKSNESGYLAIATSVYKDACAKCIAEVSDFRDLMTIRSRVKAEGLSFLTITLPSFCKDFERSLAQGMINPTFFRSFKKNGSIPAFLQGMIGLVFDRETGRLYDDNNSPLDVSTIIDSVRQICLTFKKVEMPCTPNRVQASLGEFVKIEHELSLFSLSESDHLEFLQVSDMLWGNDFGSIALDSLHPKHGPGATADGISGNQKYIWSNWHERLEPFFPFIDSAYSISAVDDEKLIENVTFLTRDQELPVKVTPVPKTMKGPRIIAIEPCCMQYAQQGVLRVLINTITSSMFASGHVNFDDQTINQELAMSASSNGLLATIDLSEASDRVPRDLALEMFRSNPDLRDMIDACRSTQAKMPDGTIIGPLNKFASMGSALCFPVESMYFYTICVAALLKAQNLPLTRHNLFNVSRDVYVYGDDLIVPSTNAITVLEYLQKYNCKINTSKTFYTGKFRESCGVDAYNGELVTPVYLGTERPENRRQASEVISWTETANLFYLKGYWHTASLMRTAVENVVGSLPYVSSNSPGLGWISLLGYRTIERWNRKLHRFEVKLWQPRPIYRSDSIDGYPALVKCLSNKERFDPSKDESTRFFDFHFKLSTNMFGDHTKNLQNTPWISHPGGAEVRFLGHMVDRYHLERSALHGAVVLKRHWAPAT